MATATELTLTLGRTAYGGDPNDDEKIQSREVKISVTWSLEEDEQDLPLAVSVLAEQAERALTEAERTVRQDPRIKPEPRTEAGTERTQAQWQPPAPCSGPAGSTAPGGMPAAGGTPASNGQHDRPAGTAPYGGKAPAPAGASGATNSRAYVPGITKTQQLAIEAYCTRHGVADWEVRRLIWNLFAKKEPRELNKDQAGELLTALQQATLQDGAENKDGADRPAYAN